MSELTCDFCGQEATKEELLVIPVDRFEIPGVISNFSWAWGACRDCKPFLGAWDWDGLLDRAVAHHGAGEWARVPLGLAYAGLRKHQNGPLRGWTEQDESEDET